jgi:hypothetical protein
MRNLPSKNIHRCGGLLTQQKLNINIAFWMAKKGGRGFDVNEVNQKFDLHFLYI